MSENSGQTSITPLPEKTSHDVTPDVKENPEPSPALLTTNELLDTAAERLGGDSAQDIEPRRLSEDTTREGSASEEAEPLPTPASEPLGREDMETAPSEHLAVSEATTSIRGVSMDDDPYDLRKFDKYFKPKVKLGPRPVTSADRAMRPGVARVAAVPASLKHTRKQESPRPQSQGQDSATRPAAAVAQFDPPVRLPPPIPIEYSPRPYSRGSVKSAPSHKSTAMTPDRLRLMKAVELRRRQLRKSQEQSSFIPPTDEDTSEMPKLLPTQTVPQPLPTLKIDKKQQHHDAEIEQSSTDDESQPQSSKADSGIEIRHDSPSYEDRDEEDQLPATDRRLTAVLAAPGEIPVQAANSEVPELAISLTESYMPTERNMVQEQVVNNASLVPTIVSADRTKPTMLDSQADAGAHVLVHTPSSETLRSADHTTENEHETSSRPESFDMTKRRRGLVEPLHIASSGNPDDFMSDDDFLEELHSATVEEAQPILLSGSLPQHHGSMEDISAVRSVSITRKPSIPIDKYANEGGYLSPEPSPALLSTSPMDTAWNAPRKVSSDISRRIQALNDLSTKEPLSGYNVSSRPLTPETSPNTFLHQDQKRRGPRKAPSPAARPVSFRRLNKNSSAAYSPAVTPATENAPVWNVQHDPVTSRNSVSVTARIVRPRTDPAQEQLSQSELMINHNRDRTSRNDLNLPPIDIAAAQQSNASSPALSPASRGSGEVRTLHSASRFSRRKRTPATPEMDESSPPPKQSMSNSSINDEYSTPKGGTRTSRFFKRVSTLSGPKRMSTATSVRSTASFLSHESRTGSRAADRASVATDHSDMPPAVVVGDLNVQFPDSLVSHPFLSLPCHY